MRLQVKKLLADFSAQWETSRELGLASALFRETRAQVIALQNQNKGADAAVKNMERTVERAQDIYAHDKETLKYALAFHNEPSFALPWFQGIHTCLVQIRSPSHNGCRLQCDQWQRGKMSKGSFASFACFHSRSSMAPFPNHRLYHAHARKERSEGVVRGDYVTIGGRRGMPRH